VIVFRKDHQARLIRPVSTGLSTGPNATLAVGVMVRQSPVKWQAIVK
jgi:hypothetical protein